MRKVLLVLSCLALLVLGALILGTGLGMAEMGLPVEGPRPTATADRVVPSGADAPSEEADASPNVPPLPDLIVESIEVIPPTPLIGQATTIRVTIKNQGTADVSLGPPPNNFWTDLYIDPAVVPIELGQDGQVSWQCQAWWVPVGGSWAVEAVYVFTDVKDYPLYAQVDTDGHVAESNANNNVLGPVQVHVRAPNVLVHESLQDFQMGLASGLDTSHPDGVLRRGIFWEPATEPEVYRPDFMINDITGTFTTTASGDELLPTTVNQFKPSLASNGSGMLFAAWEDGRSGGVWNRDVYFSRSDDGGFTWGPDVRINDVVTGNQVAPNLAYDVSRGRLYAVWQDGRNGPSDSDIYFSYSVDNGDTWSPSQKLSDDAGSAAQVNPSVVVGPAQFPTHAGEPDRVYVVWQDRRNLNDDIYLVRSRDGGASWSENFFVTDDPSMSRQDQRSPSVGVDGRGQVFVCWEDWRNVDPDNPTVIHPEVYVMWSLNEGEDFGIDVPVDVATEGQSYRVEPSLAVSTTRELVERFDEVTGITYTEWADVTAIHVVWQEGEGEQADIYYNFAVWDYEVADPCPYPYDFCFSPPNAAQLVSDFVIDSDYVLPPDSGPTWPIEPSWQGQSSIARASADDWTFCHADSVITYSKGVYLAWADARTFDDWRYEIRTRRVGAPEGSPKTFEVCEDQATGVLNDNAKLYAYRDDLDEYQIYRPAATGQANPFILSEGPPGPSFNPIVYLAWDDDRWDEPMEPGTVRNRDVFFAPMEMPAEAIYVSPVIDSRTEATWYVLSWYGVTQHFGDLLFQTRFGSDPYPPQEDITTTAWTRWTGNPSIPQPNCPGEGCFYDAPGRHIVGPDGSEWPEARYLQYKVIIRGGSRLTALSRVAIHYKGIYLTYLPTISKNH